MSQHLTEQQFIGYIHQTLTDAEREMIDRHLAQCPACRTHLADHETLQRRIDNSLSTHMRATRSLTRKNYAAIAPQVKRSRRIQMFVKGSNQFLYGTATLVVLVLLGVGLIALIGINQPEIDVTIDQTSPTVTETSESEVIATMTPAGTPLPTVVQTATPDPPTPQKRPPTTTPTLTPTTTSAQLPEWVVYNTDNSGLPSNRLGAGLTFDARGNLWVGTRDAGLAKFDGQNWTVDNTENSGLPDNNVVALAGDKQGNMWIGTGDGLAKFDGETWTTYKTSNSGLPYDAVDSLAFDAQGTLWIGTGAFYARPGEGGGVATFDGENWQVYNTENSDLPSNKIIDLAEDRQGNMWIGTDDGLAKFDGENLIAYDPRTSDLRSSLIPAIAFDGQDNIWLAEYGVAKFDGQNYTVYNTRNSGLPDNNIHDLAVDEQENIWIGTQRGLAKFDGEEWVVYDTDNSGLPINWIWTLFIDEQGNKWLATNSGGLAVYREGGVVF